MAEAFTPGQTDYIDALNTMNDTFVAVDISALTSTSTTSLLIEATSKTFTTQIGKIFSTGDWLLITSDADPANYFHGQVTSYSTTTLVINVDNIGGSGTFADWTINMSGTRGAPGSDLDWTVDQGASNIHDNNYKTDHVEFSNIGTNTHTQIDTHIALSNEHLDWSADQGGTDIHEGNIPINVVNDVTPQLAASLDGQNNQINNISLAIAAKDAVTLAQAQATALSF